MSSLRRVRLGGFVTFLLAGAACVGVVCVGVRPAGARAPADPAYRPPVDAPVVDGFREPSDPWSAGNRGLEYATEPGAAVGAVAAGVVVFAGPVARSLHVTVLHADGLRSSYSFLAVVLVGRGDRVAAGQAIGRSGDRLHLGIRDGTRYLDPRLLFGTTAVRLVPVGLPGPGDAGFPAVRDERGFLAGLVGHVVDRQPPWLRLARSARAVVGAGFRFGRDAAAGSVHAVSDWGRRALAELATQVTLADHYRRALDPTALTMSVLGHTWRQRRQDCTPASVSPVVPTGRRIAVLVAGFGSSSTSAAIDEVDTAALGYAAGDAVRFSYAGGRTPDPTDGGSDPRLAALPSSPYDAYDSTGPLRPAAARLAELLRDVRAAAPGVPIDVLAHSQGGVVAHLALSELARDTGGGPAARPAGLDGFGLVATIGSPHQGADLATAGQALDLLGLPPVGVDPGRPAVDDLSETSALRADLDAGPLPGPTYLTIGARGDLVVPGPRTTIAGVPAAVIDLGGTRAHDQLPGDARTTRELALALAGRPPTCETVVGALADGIIGSSVGLAEDLLGAGLLGVSLLPG